MSEGVRVQLVHLALERAINYMAEDGVIDVHPLRREDVLDDMLKAVMRSSDFDEAVKKARNILVESNKVEEVYGTDDELDTMLRASFQIVEETAAAELKN